MGGIGMYITATRGKDAELTPAELHRALWRSLHASFAQRLRKAPNAVTTTDYLPTAMYRGLPEESGDGEGREWDIREGKKGKCEFGFWFDDASGCCSMSMYACMHWVEMAYAALGAAGLSEGGWTVEEPERRVENVLALGTAHPIAYLKSGMFTMSRRKPGAVIGEPAGDDELPDDCWVATGDSTGLKWSTLEAKGDRALIEFAAMTGHCWCDVCTSHRKKLRPAALQYTVKRTAPLVRRAWELLEAGRVAKPKDADASRCKALEKQAAKAIAAWDWREAAGPPELSVLSDWFAERDIELVPDVLAGIVHTHAR